MTTAPMTTVGPAMRQSHDRAQAAGCSLAEMRVLFAIHYYLVTYSKLTDRRSLGQIAATAGMWDGDPKQLPHAHRKRLTQRLRALEAAGAITYSPGRGHGHISTFVVPEADEKGEHSAPPLKGEHSGPPLARKGEHSGSTKGSTQGPQRGALRTPHAVSTSSEASRGGGVDELGRLNAQRERYQAQLDGGLPDERDRTAIEELLADVERQMEHLDASRAA
jgi:hypothetical protein